MANVRLVHPNLADRVALVGVPAFHASLPVSNLQDETRGRLARSTTSQNQVIWGNCAELSAVTMIALSRHNLTPVGTARVKLWQDLNRSGALLYDSGVLTIGAGTFEPWGDKGWGLFPWGMSGVTDWPVPTWTHWFTEISAYSFELTLNDPANQKSYLQAARLFLGKHWAPAVNLNYGGRLGWREETRQTRSAGGTLRSDSAPQFRRWAFDLDWLSSADAVSLLDICRRAGMREQLFLSVYPQAGGERERNYEGVVKVAQMPDTAHRYAPFFGSSLLFEES